jgi:hypothetical protein
MFGPFGVDRSMVLPQLVSAEMIVVESITVMAIEIANIGNVKLNIANQRSRIFRIIVNYGICHVLVTNS